MFGKNKVESTLRKRIGIVEGRLILRRACGKVDPALLGEWDEIARRSAGFSKAIFDDGEGDDSNDLDDRTP